MDTIDNQQVCTNKVQHIIAYSMFNQTIPGASLLVMLSNSDLIPLDLLSLLHHLKGIITNRVHKNFLFVQFNELEYDVSLRLDSKQPTVATTTDTVFMTTSYSFDNDQPKLMVQYTVSVTLLLIDNLRCLVRTQYFLTVGVIVVVKSSKETIQGFK